VATNQSFKAPNIPKLNKKIVSSSVLSKAPKLKVTKINIPISNLVSSGDKSVEKLEKDNTKESLLAQESLIRVVNSLNRTGEVLNSLTDYLVTESKLEQQLLKDKLKRDKLEEENQKRTKKESNLEGVGKKARNAFLAPVKSIGNKAKGFFDTIKDVLLALGTGWLTDKGLKALEMASNNDISGLENLGKTITDSLGKLVLILGSAFIGIKLVSFLLKRLAGKLISKAFRGAVRAFTKQKPIRPKARPSGGSAGKGTRTTSGGRSMRGGPDIRNPLRTKPKITSNLTDSAIDAATTGSVKSSQYKSPIGPNPVSSIDGPALKAPEIPKPKTKPKPGLGKRIFGFIGDTAKAAKQAADDAVKGALALGQKINDFAAESLKKLGEAGKKKILEPLNKFIKPVMEPIAEKFNAIGSKVTKIIEGLPGFKQVSGALKKQGIGGLGDIKGISKKVGGKAIPVLGGLVNLAFGYDRLEKGDSIGGGLELLSGILDLTGLIPGNVIGPGASMAIDAYMLARDFVPSIKEGEDSLVEKLGLTSIREQADTIVGKLPSFGQLSDMIKGAFGEGVKPTEQASTSPKPLPSADSMAGDGMKKRVNPLPFTSRIPSAMPNSEPSVIYKKVNSNAGAVPQMSSSNDSITKTPNISSSNPDNFFVLYSQVQYNVVR